MKIINRLGKDEKISNTDHIVKKAVNSSYFGEINLIYHIHKRGKNYQIFLKINKFLTLVPLDVLYIYLKHELPIKTENFDLRRSNRLAGGQDENLIEDEEDVSDDLNSDANEYE
ncbi:uncharacterized protein KGF55_000443 [Candida pseudojiufengensis]|uniref:uncharacterized protein n=1 Tax=Candida pseudojiufengensis TaxID=497109 RepID=UPI002223F0D6|nr:uncharacterized protein KGF55_000443 [Candida pseudojiufengensis]KAI5967033.1 hypothetical protein KGF55_000443 [Candida pseudojiufengensis]